MYYYVRRIQQNDNYVAPSGRNFPVKQVESGSDSNKKAMIWKMSREEIMDVFRGWGWKDENIHENFKFVPIFNEKDFELNITQRQILKIETKLK